MPPSIAKPFIFLARHAQWVLAGGLVAGIAFPAAAGILRPYIPEMVALILFLSALRMDVSALVVSRKIVFWDLVIVLILQLAVPVLLFSFFTILGETGMWRDVLTVLFTASGISGIPAFAFLMGLDGVRAMRLLVLGTALLPFTSLPVLSLLPEVAAQTSLTDVSLRLLGLILLAAVAALIFRRPVIRALGSEAPQIVNGMNTLMLAVFVLALMDAIQPLMLSDPIRVLIVLFIACTVNFGGQFIYLGFVWTRSSRNGHPITVSEVTPFIPAGNRNMALFLAALPASVTDPWLLFIGCYQVPMYLTPMVMKPVLKRLPMQWDQRIEANRKP